MFDDKRSKKVIFVAHCVLNQNAKPDGQACYPGAIKEVIQFLLNEGIGISQMPCPEAIYLGLDRQTPPGSVPCSEEENTRLCGLLLDPEALEIAEYLAAGPIHQTTEYIKNGFEVLGIIGINGSISCGIETTWEGGKEMPGQGIFIEEIARLLAEKGLNIPMRGITTDSPEEAVAICKKLIRDSEK